MGVLCYSNKKKNIRKNDKNDKIDRIDNFFISYNPVVINANISQNKEKNINNKQENIYENLLKKHNECRNKYGATNLELNEELCQLAQEYADKCAEFQNTDLNPFSYKNECLGENISEFDGDISTALTICENWANERNNYNFRDKVYKDQTKHFTQMIWKNTQIVGFGFSSSSNEKNYFVSFYFPAGNIFEEFDKNISN